MNHLRYTHRTYRDYSHLSNLVSFETKVRETDLMISAEKNLEDSARKSVIKYRNQIEQYARVCNDFLTSFAPLSYDDLAPAIVKEMLRASISSGVGPMASVAGAIAQFVAGDLLLESSEIIVENGGDIYALLRKDLRIGLFAGDSPLSNKLSFTIKAEDLPMGICTSSATVGHSISLGKADAVCVISKSAALADAAATAVGNAVQNRRDIRKGIDVGSRIQGVLGIVVIIGAEMGAYGNIEFN